MKLLTIVHHPVHEFAALGLDHQHLVDTGAPGIQSGGLINQLTTGFHFGTALRQALANDDNKGSIFTQPEK